MASYTDDKSESGMYEINITPFVDVMLVLLILFMISTPALIEKGLKISLPQAATSEDLSHVTLRLAIEADGSVRLDRRPIDTKGLEKAVDDLFKNQVITDALISADAKVPHGRVMEVSDLLRGKGVTHIGFATEKKK